MVCQQKMEVEGSVIDQVEKALYQLYSDPTQNDVSSAEKWLSLVQQSPEAWTISWQLLRKEKVEIKNFGALLLQNKIARYWNELPQEQYEPLKIELFKAILEFSTGPKLILTRLCVAMVMYMFHAIPQVWPNALVSVISTFNSNKPQNTPGSNTKALLELLKILPEEFDRTNNDLFAQKRVLIRQEILRGRTTVFLFLEQLLCSQQQQPGNDFIGQSIVSCISSWSVNFCPPLPEIKSLVEVLFNVLRNPVLLSDVAEALVKILSHDDSYKYPLMLQQFLIHLLQSSDFINSHLQQDEPDMDACYSLCYLATNVMDNNMTVLVDVTEESSDCSEESIDGLQLLLGFTLIPGSYPVNEKCSDVTLSFWEVFLDKIASENADHAQFLLDFYGSIIRSLVECFPVKCQYPSEEDWADGWDETEKEEFFNYRERLRDLGESIQCTLHTEYVEHLTLLLNNILQSATPTWQTTESVLYLLQGVTSNITDSTSVQFINVLSVFPKMPSHSILVKTALGLLGNLSNWFSRQPDVLQYVLPMILNGLKDPSVVTSASIAFRDVCGDCSQQLTQYVAEIIQACQVSLSIADIAQNDCSRIMAAMGCVLSCLPLSSLSGPLESLTSALLIPQLEQLTVQEPSVETRPLVHKEVCLLSSLCQHIYPTIGQEEQHPVIMLLVRVWPSFKILLSKWIEDGEIVCTLCSCLKRAIKNCQHHYLPLMEESTQIILQCFNVSHHSELLKVAKELIKHFGSVPSCIDFITGFLQNLLTACFQYCHEQGLPNIDPDILKNFIKLYTQTLHSSPHILMNMDGMLLNGINLGMSSLHLPEVASIKASSCLLVSIVSCSSSHDVINQLVLIKGRDLVECLLKGVAGSIGRSQLDHVSNVLIALSQYQLEGLATWLKELLLQGEGFPSPHPSPAEKELFRSAILQSQGNKKIIKEKVKEFSLVCRGFHGTVYSIETSSRHML